MKYDYVSEKVLEVYQRCNIKSFPVNCFQIFKVYGYSILTYQELKDKNPELYKLCSLLTDDAYHDPELKIVVYNDKQFSRRILFSLAHEIGHIVLGHTVRTQENEDEADKFASQLLAPRIAMHHFRCETADQTHEMFGISYEAANYALIDYRKWFINICWTTRKPSEPEQQLEQFLFGNNTVNKPPVEPRQVKKGRQKKHQRELRERKEFFDEMRNEHGDGAMFEHAESQFLYGG